MKKIKLTQNKYVVVDDRDYDWINQWKWCIDDKGYAIRAQWLPKDRKYFRISMARLLNNTPIGLYTDHINRNKLDNRRINLRSVTNQKNAFNTKRYNTNKSGCKGVHFDKWSNKWRATIGLNYKMIKLGRFKNKKQAIIARKEAEKIYHEIRLKHFNSSTL